MFRPARSFMLGLTLLCAAAAPAGAASWLEKSLWLPGPSYDAVLPPCQDPAVLGKIAKRGDRGDTPPVTPCTSGHDLDRDPEGARNALAKHTVDIAKHGERDRRRLMEDALAALKL